MSDVKVALRTLNLFELFAKQRQPLVLSDLAEQLDIPSSSCLALIRTLSQRGYLYQTWGRFVFVVKSDGRKASTGVGVLA